MQGFYLPLYTKNYTSIDAKYAEKRSNINNINNDDNNNNNTSCSGKLHISVHINVFRQGVEHGGPAAVAQVINHS